MKESSICIEFLFLFKNPNSFEFYGLKEEVLLALRLQLIKEKNE